MTSSPGSNFWMNKADRSCGNRTFSTRLSVAISPLQRPVCRQTARIYFSLHSPGWAQPFGKYPCPHRDRKHPNARCGTQALYAEAPRLVRGYEAFQHSPDHAAPAYRGHGNVRECRTVPDQPAQRLQGACERSGVLGTQTRPNETRP